MLLASPPLGPHPAAAVCCTAFIIPEWPWRLPARVFAVKHVSSENPWLPLITPHRLVEINSAFAKFGAPPPELQMYHTSMCCCRCSMARRARRHHGRASVTTRWWRRRLLQRRQQRRQAAGAAHMEPRRGSVWPCEQRAADDDDVRCLALVCCVHAPNRSRRRWAHRGEGDLARDEKFGLPAE